MTMLPIRGDAQGRDGGCAPLEPRPAARADMTGALSPRTIEGKAPGAVAHAGPGASAYGLPLAVQTDRRLRAAGIRADDPGLEYVRAWNARGGLAAG
jgi:hypothetical protein